MDSLTSEVTQLREEYQILQQKYQTMLTVGVRFIELRMTVNFFPDVW